jgi:hypothetical protein
MKFEILKRPRVEIPNEDLGKILNQLTRLQEDQAARDAKRDGRESRQNRWQIVQLVIALATMAGVAAAFIFRYANLREQQQAAATQDQESRYSSISQVELDVDTAIADNPRLISCFHEVTCDAKPPLTPEEAQKASALATYIVDFYQYLYTQLENLKDVPDNGRFTLRENNIPGANTVIPGVSDENWVTWSETIFGGFESSQLLCNALQGSSSAYEQEFVHAVAITEVCPKLPDPGSAPGWSPE